MRTWKQIKWKGIECTRNVEKEYKIGIYEQWAYYMAKVILKPYTDVKRNKSIKTAPKPKGDKVKFKIPKKDYLQLAENLISFVEKKNRMPNYLTYQGERIRCRLYVYLFSKALKYFNEHKTFPASITIDYKAFYPPKTFKKYGRSTEYGCDNRGQNTGYYCACHMAQEIIRNLTGEIISQSTIASIMGTTTDGTGHDGINTFFEWFNRNYKYTLSYEWKNFSEIGWKGMKQILESNNQDAGIHELYRNTWGHYTNFDAIYNETIDVHNSLGDRCDAGCYCGYTENRTKNEAESYMNGISQKSVLIVTRKE